MLRSIVGTIGLIMVFGASSADQMVMGMPLEFDLSDGGVLILPDGVEVMPDPSTRYSTTMDKRIAACVAFGNSNANCTCRAETSSRFLSEDDFIEESGYIDRSDYAGLTEFHHRKSIEHPHRMLQMGQALSECPADRFALE